MRFVAILLCLICSASVGAEDPVRYELSFDGAVHHEAKVRIVWTGLRPGPLRVRFSRSSPGRYALHEFAKNVFDTRAFDSKGNALTVKRPTPHGWDVSGHDGTVAFEYRLFARRSDGTYSDITVDHAHLNMPATVAWALGHDKRAIEIRFVPPEKSSWRVASQLQPGRDAFTFRAKDLAELIDSPTEVSDHHVVSFHAGQKKNRQEIRLAVHHEGSKDDLRLYAKLAEAVVLEQIEVFGELPTFDHSRYTFIADYRPGVSGDGMEHRNSTILTTTRAIRPNPLRNLGTLSHEFFHAWNVERIRPRALEPFDLTRANPCGELWFGEGFTSYYTNLSIVRAQLMSLESYTSSLTYCVDATLNAPGRSFFSVVEMSRNAPFVDAATAIDPTNTRNTHISYYTWGQALGLALDLELRSRFKKDLDGYMKALWRSHGVTEKPYEEADLEWALGSYVGDTGFAKTFFDRFIRGKDAPDFARLLEHAGIELSHRFGDKSMDLRGARVEAVEEGWKISANPLAGTPLYEAGLGAGDVLTDIEGATSGAQSFDKALSTIDRGSKVAVKFRRRGQDFETKLEVVRDPRVTLQTFEEADRVVTEEIRAFRKNWLDRRSKVAIDLPEKTCPKCERSFPFLFNFCGVDGEELDVFP